MNSTNSNKVTWFNIYMYVKKKAAVKKVQGKCVLHMLKTGVLLARKTFV